MISVCKSTLLPILCFLETSSNMIFKILKVSYSNITLICNGNCIVAHYIIYVYRLYYNFVLEYHFRFFWLIRDIYSIHVFIISVSLYKSDKFLVYIIYQLFSTYQFDIYLVSVFIIYQFHFCLFYFHFH